MDEDRLKVLREQKTLTKGNRAKCLNVGIMRNPERELMGQWSFLVATNE